MKWVEIFLPNCFFYLVLSLAIDGIIDQHQDHHLKDDHEFGQVN